MPRSLPSPAGPVALRSPRRPTTGPSGSGTPPTAARSVLIREETEVVALAYSPDGTRLATVVAGEVVIRSAANGGQLLRFRAHPGAVNGLAYSPDGTRLATSGSEGSASRSGTRRRALSASPCARRPRHTPSGLAFDPRGDSLAVATGAAGAVLVWDTRGNQPDVTLLRHNGWVRGVAFSGDGSRLASACDDGTVKLWDVALAQDLLTLRDPEAAPASARLPSAPTAAASPPPAPSESSSGTPHRPEIQAMFGSKDPRVSIRLEEGNCHESHRVPHPSHRPARARRPPVTGRFCRLGSDP